MFKPTSRSPVYVRRDNETDLTASLMVYEEDGSLTITISNDSQSVSIPADQWHALIVCIDHELDLNT
jgi:hypothetical protein